LGDKNYVASHYQQILGCGPEFPRLWDYPAIPPLTSNYFSDKVFDELIHRCLSKKIRNLLKDLSKQISQVAGEQKVRKQNCSSKSFQSKFHNATQFSAVSAKSRHRFRRSVVSRKHRHPESDDDVDVDADAFRL
jgi:hypothetical protein